MCWEIHLAEQATVHIRVVAPWIERADRVILVEVVSRHITKGEQARSMTFDEQGVDSFRRRARGQAQHRAGCEVRSAFSIALTRNSATARLAFSASGKTNNFIPA